MRESLSLLTSRKRLCLERRIFVRRKKTETGQTLVIDLPSLIGDVADETFAGTYTVNSDCTETDVVQVFLSGQLVRTTTVQSVVDENGQHARSIYSKVELPDGTLLPAVITADATRLFPKD